jgi:hypothetical protein
MSKEFDYAALEDDFKNLKHQFHNAEKQLKEKDNRIKELEERVVIQHWLIRSAEIVLDEKREKSISADKRPIPSSYNEIIFIDNLNTYKEKYK